VIPAFAWLQSSLRSSSTEAERKKRHKKRRLLVDKLEERELLATRVVTIGDSWSGFIANGAPGSIADSGTGNSIQTVLDLFGTGHQVYNGSFYGGTAAQHASSLGDITNSINAAGPDADIVYLSSGGNDLLLGQLGGGWFFGMPNENALFDTIGSNVQTVVNHILSIRPDIQIVIGGYDHLNMWDFDLSDNGNLLRANYALGVGGLGDPTFPILDLPSQQAINAAVRGIEQRKINIANADHRVHYVDNINLLNSIFGYDGYFGTLPGGLPRNTYNDFPVDKTRLNNGNDPIHLDTTGYDVLATNTYNSFLVTAFQSAQLSTNTGTLDFGNVRIGTTSGSQTVVASNVGPNFTKVENLAFPAASGAFSGAASGANPLFRDPTLGSQTATSQPYSFSPTSHGGQSQNLSVTSNSGSASLSLQGNGVGPELSTSSQLDFGSVEAGQMPQLDLALTNSTSDGDLGSLTNLTLVSAQITGPDSARFSLDNFTSGTVISAGSTFDLAVEFDGSLPVGEFDATLTLVTDVGAALGATGQSFVIPLSGEVINTGPELALSGPATGVPGQPRTFTFDVTGGTGGNFTFDIDWDGDAVTDETVVGPSGTQVEHVFLTTGSFNVSASATDQGSSQQTDPAGMSINVSRFALQSNEQNPGLTNLAWGGTDGLDIVFFLPLVGNNVGIFSVVVGNQLLNDVDVLSGVDGQIEAYGLGGSDILVAELVSLPVSIVGGNGDDILSGGTAADFINGGFGNDMFFGTTATSDSGDTLIGGQGRDFFYGNLGGDSIDGGNGQDLLIAGNVNFTAGTTVDGLIAIRNEWLSSRDYATRVANISGTGSGPKLNGNFFLEPDQTVFSDSAGDQLFGGADLDWFLYGFLLDSVDDAETGEVETDTDP